MKNKNKLMNIVGEVEEEELVSINESNYYAYYSTLLMLTQTGSNIQNIKLFRYKSVGETALWEEVLKDMSKKRVLFLYTLFDEISSILSWKNTHGIDVKKLSNSQKLSFFTRMSIVGYMASRILKEDFFNNFKGFGPGGEAFQSLISLGNRLGESGRASFFWNEGMEEDISDEETFKDMNMYMHSILKVFNTSEFLSKHDENLNEIISLLDIIEKEKLIDRFFSIKKAIFANIVDHTKKESEISKYIVFIKRFPLWVDTSGNNSFFSFLFLDMLDKKAKEYILTIEYLRIYLSMGKSERKKIKDSSFLYLVTIMMDTNNKKFSTFTDEFKSLSSILLAGGDISEQRAFFAFLHIKKTIELYRSDIVQIVDIEGAEISTQIKLLKSSNNDVSEKDIQDLTKLFFINIFRKIESFLSDSGGILYEELSEKDKTRLSLLLSSIIKSRIPKVIKLGGVFDG